VTLQRLEAGYQKGAIPERSVREAERNVESDQIALAKAERTLRSWRLSDQEIDAIKAEAERIRLRKGERNPALERDWARVEVRAPFAGTVLEKNITAVGDIVDTSIDLYKIADLSKLSVWAHAYEEDLPAILALPRPIHWLIQLKSDPRLKAFPGTVDKIGAIIDPNQHTALILGQVDNAEGRLRAGQFITATIEVPPSADEVVLPTTALVEDGYDSIVFVQPNPDRPEFALRRVVVARRQQKEVFVRSKLNPKGPPAGSSAKDAPLSPIQPGDLVVAAGALELKAKMEDLRDARK
jgi:membrane fusion protein, heavy metal efflux system